ncbi:MAG: DUF4454 domain-containing protein [Enterocloster bolteae]
MENDTDRDKLDGRNQCGLEDLPPAPYLQYPWAGMMKPD